MRVLHIIHGRHLYPQAKQAIRLISEQLSRRIGVEVICESDCIVGIAAQTVGARIAPFPEDALAGHKQLAWLREIIRELGPDLVHVHCESGDGVIPGIAARLAGVQRVLSSDLPKRINPVPGILGTNVYNGYLTAFQETEERLVKRGLAAAKIGHVRVGINANEYQPTWSAEKFRYEFDFEKDHFVIGIRMNLSTTQENAHLLKILPLLTAAYASTRVVILGEGSGEDALEKGLDGLQLKSLVRLAGMRTDLNNFLGHFDLALNLGTDRNRAVELLEAQAAGVPVAGFDIPWSAELVARQNAENLVPARDYQALAAAVQRLVYRPRQRRAIIDNTQKWIRTEFAISDMAVSYLEAYARVMWKSDGAVKASCETA